MKLFKQSDGLIAVRGIPHKTTQIVPLSETNIVNETPKIFFFYRGYLIEVAEHAGYKYTLTGIYRKKLGYGGCKIGENHLEEVLAYAVEQVLKDEEAQEKGKADMYKNLQKAIEAKIMPAIADIIKEEKSKIKDLTNK